MVPLSENNKIRLKLKTYKQGQLINVVESVKDAFKWSAKKVKEEEGLCPYLRSFEDIPLHPSSLNPWFEVYCVTIMHCFLL